MRHHFGDMLDREGGYWTTIPNRERYAYRIGYKMFAVLDQY